ncbi:MAG: LCP family protein [Acutalibacteraceae bacterium]|nr:LCP family protein [Acutalibacteraceae bacterium]
MSDRKNQNEEKKVSINDDYIELLSYVKKKDEYEDIYSYSSHDEDEYEDIFSDSSKEDIYISKGRRKAPEEDGIYISRSKASYQQKQTEEYNEDEFSVEIPVTPPLSRKKSLQDTDEISDFEARRGKLVSEKNGSKGKKIVAIILAVVLAFGAILFVMANSVVGKFTKAEDIEHIEGVELISDKNVRNILLIGCDKANGGSSRSDSIMIASVNKKTGRITVCSILRDTHLYIPGEREAKVNAAYAWGGANLLIQTIEQNFGIKIDDYATVNFEMFTALVDGLGGVDVEVTENEADYINNRHRYGKEKKPDAFESGESVHLNGYQALWYSRIRKLDSDFMRTQRQRKVISAIASKVKGQLNPIGIFGLVSTAKEVAPYIETTLSISDFWSLVFSLSGCLAKSGADMDKLLVSQQIPFDDTWWYSSQWDGSSISINLEENKQMLYTLLYEEPVEESTEEVTE